MKKVILILLSLSALLWVSCGGGGGGGGTPPPPAVTISISPTSSTVEIGATAQFTATVHNATNTAVTWQVNDVDGGNATVGTISTAGLYTAPASVPSPADVTVKAIAQADTTKTATATVTIKLRITVTPASATVSAAGTQQFSALVEGVANTAVTWQVEGVTGGNATVGTISTSGLYTAPLAIPAGGTVTVAGVSQADSTKSASATVTIIFSSAMLSGQYAFSYIGWDPLFFAFAGSFFADGSGTITSGVADLNTNYDVPQAITLTGTIEEMNADGRVVIHLSDSLGNNYTLRAVMISPGHLRVIQFDTFANGQGVIDKQDPASFSNAAFTGDYAFRLDGYGFGGCMAGFAGRMTADDARNLTAGFMDVNDGCAGDENEVALTGSYTDIDAATGRGTATLDTALGPMNFAFYMVSANKAHLISLDYLPGTLGFAEKQTLGTFSNANVTGNYAFFTTGYTYNSTDTLYDILYYNAGRFTANGAGAVSAGVSDENDGGVTLENLAFIGEYSVAANGRGTGSFTSSRGTSNFSFYMVSPSRALFVQQGTFAVATGELDAQSGSFSTGSLAGDYGMSLDGLPDMIVGQFNATGSSGAASGTVDINTWDSANYVFVPTPDQAFTATYSVTANGRGDFTVSGTPPITFHLYMVSGSKTIIIGMSNMFLGVAEKQF